ncbi:hypothetical protein ACTQ6A_14150 [Lachnospiraceae bacterium LCP25S3_G4]
MESIIGLLDVAICVDGAVFVLGVAVLEIAWFRNKIREVWKNE